jgi:acyl-CoA synthetase (AMP-forming)/AMP-acid ligase II
VARAAVIAHHEDLLAFVEPRAGEAAPEPAALSAALARLLAPHKRPSRILVVSRLPMGPGGEIQRGTLPDLLV